MNIRIPLKKIDEIIDSETAIPLTRNMATLTHVVAGPSRVQVDFASGMSVVLEYLDPYEGIDGLVGVGASFYEDNIRTIKGTYDSTREPEIWEDGEDWKVEEWITEIAYLQVLHQLNGGYGEALKNAGIAAESLLTHLDDMVYYEKSHLPLAKPDGNHYDVVSVNSVKSVKTS